MAASLLELRDRQIVFALVRSDAAQRIQAFRHAQIGGPQQARPDRHSLLGEFRPSGIFAASRQKSARSLALSA